jgi:hypothetical protein
MSLRSRLQNSSINFNEEANYTQLLATSCAGRSTKTQRSALKAHPTHFNDAADYTQALATSCGGLLTKAQQSALTVPPRGVELNAL